MKKYWSDSSSIGKLSILIGLFVAVPLLILPWYPDDSQYLLAFLIPSLSSILLGVIICVCGKRDAEASMNWRSFRWITPQTPPATSGAATVDAA